MPNMAVAQQERRQIVFYSKEMDYCVGQLLVTPALVEQAGRGERPESYQIRPMEVHAGSSTRRSSRALDRDYDVQYNRVVPVPY